MTTATPPPAILLTGASGGIGSACAKTLAHKGFHVYAGVRASTPALDATGITQIPLDVTDPDSVTAAAEEVGKRQDGAGLYALINNAGVLVQGPAELVPDREWQRQFEVNVHGAVRVTQAFLPALRAGGGRIVNISAASARVALPFLGPIAASKAALESISDALRVELAPWGIPVSVVQPGAMRTAIFDKASAAAEDALAHGDPRAVARYEQQRIAFEKAVAGQRFSPVETVVEVIRKAVEARRPKAYYTAGPDARQAVWLARIPPRLRDGLLIRALGLSGIEPARAH
ncbi:SDR family oxidoreductase [Nocardia yamanashiensis]|uniref:SDR family oxidoreductase n=1 Tax=Nocardia yamanashiensis TaxID=209247 RepID=UPI00082D7415|nr:SDR family oxidoreductase [Nocardia yamanashiensis]